MGLLKKVDDSSETDLIDLAVTDLEVYALPADVDSAIARGINTSPSEPDESLHDELIDTALGELVEDFV